MRNNVDLATTTSVTTTYAGEFAGKYIAAALLEANTLASGGFDIMPNVKYKAVLKKAATSGLVKDGSCDFTAVGNVTLTEKVITPESFQINVQMCKSDFRTDWEAAQMGYSAHDQLPPKFSDFIIGHIAAQLAEQIEQNIWSGDTTTSGEFDGIETQLAVDTDLVAAQEIQGVAVTSANVQAQLREITNAIPNRIYGKEGLRIYASVNIVKAYIASLGGFGASGLGANGVDAKGTMWYTDGSLSFDGIDIFMANGMTSDTAICTYKDNLVFATGLMNDQNEVKIIDTSEILGDQNVRIVMRYTAAATYKYAEDIVTYGIRNIGVS